MARLFSSGFELQSTTNYIEFDSVISGTLISTTTKRSGAASLRCNPTAATRYVRHQFRAASQTNNIYCRFYVYITTAPAALSSIFVTYDTSGAVNYHSIRMNSNRTLELWNNVSNTQMGSDSSALNTDQWYRIEFSYIYSNSATTAYIDGVQFATGTSNIGMPNRFDLGMVSSATCDLYFDDLAINDSTGSYQTGLPGDGKIIHLNTSGAGDNTQWTPSTGNNWDCVNETPPSETDYVYQSTLNYIDDYNVSDSGIGASDTVNVVAVGSRHTNDTASSSMAYRLRIKKASSGTVAESANIIPNSTAWRTFKTAVPRVHQLTTYKDPDNINNWTQTTLDSMQIGVKGTVDSSYQIRVSKIWALVDYTPAGDTNISASVQTATVSNISAVINAVRNVALAVGVLVCSFYDPTPQITAISGQSVEVSADIEQLTFTNPAPSVSIPAEATIEAPAQNPIFFVLNPTITTYATLKTDYFKILFYPASFIGEPNVLSSTFSQPTATITASKDITCSATVQSATYSQPTATISTTKNISSVATIQAATYSQPTATISTVRSTSNTATIQTAQFSNPTPSITYNDNEQIALGISGGAFSQPTAVISAIRNVSMAPDIQSAVFTILDPDVLATKSIQVSPAIQEATFTVLSPTIQLGGHAQSDADIQEATFSQPASSITTEINVSIAPETGIIPDTAAHWKMNDNAATTTVINETGADHGTFLDATGDPNTNAHDTAGVINGALTFDGTDDGIQITDSANIRIEGGNDFSVSFWVYLNSYNNNVLPRFWEKRSLFGCFMGDSGNGKYRKVALEMTNASATAVEYWGSTLLNTGQWYHIVMTFDTTNGGKIYINSVAETMSVIGTWSGDIQSTSGYDFYLARRRTDSARNLSGNLDDFRIFNRVITQSEILALYNPGVAVALFSNISPTIQTGAGVSVSPDVLEGTLGQPAATAAGIRNLSIQPTVQSGAVSMIQPTISAIRNVSSTATLQTFTFSIIQPTITGQDTEAVSASLQESTFSIPTPAVSTSKQITVSLDAESATFSNPDPIVALAEHISVSPDRQSVLFSQPTAIVSAFGKNPYRGRNRPYSRSTSPYTNKNIYRNFPKI